METSFQRRLVLKLAVIALAAFIGVFMSGSALAVTGGSFAPEQGVTLSKQGGEASADSVNTTTIVHTGAFAILSGTATDGSTMTVQDTGAFTPNALAGEKVTIVSTGDGAPQGETRTIAAGNTADVITVTSAFSAAVEAGDTYRISTLAGEKVKIVTTTNTAPLTPPPGGPPNGETRTIAGNTADVITVTSAFSAAVESGDGYRILDLSTGAAADQTINLTFNAPDYQFGSTTTFSPEDGFVAPGPGHPDYTPGDSNPDLGDVMGYISNAVNLGLSNAACNFGLDLRDFAFLNATVNTTHTIDPYSTTEAPTEDEDSATGKGTLAIMRLDDDDDGNAGEGEDSNKLPNHVDHYPSYLNTLFTPWGGNPVQPLARYSASMRVDGNAIVLMFLQFAPGALGPDGADGTPGNSDDGFDRPHPLSDLGDPSLGYASVTVLQNPTEVSWSSISDFCSGLVTTTILFGESRENPCLGGSPATYCDEADEYNGFNTPCNPLGVGGVPRCDAQTNTTEDRYKNPSNPGTYFFTGVHGSQRDTDGDGHENGLDPCPTVATPDWNPRIDDGTWDPDGDGLPGKDDPGVGGEQLLAGSGCDPTPLTTNPNHDGDLEPKLEKHWQNRLDNCPLLADLDPDAGETGLNIECEIEDTTPYYESIPRGGPRGDTMGDLCEGSAQQLDCTDVGYVEEEDDMRSNGDFHTVMTRMPVCIGDTDGNDTDADNDGWCADDTPGTPPEDPGEDPDDSDDAKTQEDFSLYVHLPLATTGSGTDPAGDANATSSVSDEPVQVCNDGIDNDGDTKADMYGVDLNDDGDFNDANELEPEPECQPDHGSAADFPTGDSDGDGWRDTYETFIGTDALGRCQVGRPYGNIPSNDWPLDLHGGSATLDSRNMIDVSDFGALLAPTRYLNTSPGMADYDRRYDTLPGSGGLGDWINGLDFNAPLAPVRYLNGPLCTPFTDFQRWEYNIVIEKQTIPDGDSKSFEFTGEITAKLSDGQASPKKVAAGGTYDVTETVPAGWTLTSIVCDDGASTTPSTGNVGTKTATFNVDGTEIVKCTFTNTKQ